jgi:hypothetical protein
MADHHAQNFVPLYFLRCFFVQIILFLRLETIFNAANERIHKTSQTNYLNKCGNACQEQVSRG